MHVVLFQDRNNSRDDDHPGNFISWHLVDTFLKETMAFSISELELSHADGGPRSHVCAPETFRSAPHRHE
jgi:hypothetical protein